MGSRLRKARGSLKNEKEGTSSEKYEVSYKELSSLMRIRDFISLLLTYPMKLDEEGILKSWICAFPEWKAQLLSTRDDTVIDKPWRVLTEKALRLIEGFMPMEMISKIESGERSIFSHNDAIPEAILHLTVDLAVNQLIQTLFSSDYSACYHYVRLLTRNLAEKRCVVDKIVAALKEKYMYGVDKDFVRALWINASTYETDAEVRVQEQITTKLAGSFVTEDHELEEKMASNRYLVIVVDADSNKKLDLQKVHFPAGIVVLISTEPSTQAEKDDEFRITCAMDLNIRTQDHLLSWEVFCSYLDRSMVLVRSPVAIQRIAVEIVKECHGHLLATVLVAKYLKNVEDVKQWEVALYKLSNVNPFYDYQDSDRIGISRVMVNAFLNIIWEDIDDTQKLCLEFSLFDHNIKNGVRHATLISDSASILLENTKEMTVNLDEVGEYTRAEHCIRELLHRFVLLKYESRVVYLPVETYDIIKSLHTSNPSIIRHGVLGLTEAPYIGRWHGLIRIELMDNKICELPQSPDCPKLKVLLLQGNVDLMDIPDSFFNHMPLLQHLDLSSTSIRDLPPSLSKLIQLEKFYLRGCDLFMELSPQIGQLKNLEELDLDGTLITHLPGEIRELMNLKSLTLCFDGYHHVLGHGKKEKQISNSTIIPPGVISTLTQLKYLNINVDPEDERWNENVNWVFMEILGLKWLETVSIYVPKADLLKLMPVHKSLNFRLVVGHHMQRFISRVTPEVEQIFKLCDHSIKFVNGENVPLGVQMILRNFKALYLDRHMTIKSLSDFELRFLHRLQICILAECNEMKSIVKRRNVYDRHALPNLEFLSVFYMKNLRRICESPNPSFLHLKSIALHTCPMLTTVFTLDSLNILSSLEEIIIEDCPKVTTLVSLDSPKPTTQLSLPRLTRILLLYLPELVNIFNGLHVEQGLEQMVFYYCPKLQSLSKSELSSKYLKIIKGESMWWEALKWNAAEWGDAGGPKLFEQIFSPINEEADMMNQLAAYQETQINADHNEYQVHHKMCAELRKLVDRILRILPRIEEARPSSSGMQALCLLTNAIGEAKQLLLYCSESSKLYLAITGDSILSKCQKARKSLLKSLVQIQNMVPVTLAAEISRLIDDLECVKFVLDSAEEEAGKVMKKLLQPGPSASDNDSMENFEIKDFQFVAARLGITNPTAIVVEKRSIQRLLEKVKPHEQPKEIVLKNLLVLLIKHRKSITGEEMEAYSQSEGPITTENSGHESQRIHHVKSDPYLNHDQYRTHAIELARRTPPEEYKCPISFRLMYDPVVIASGETYERMWIQKWFDEGNTICPKTKKKLHHMTLTPNVSLKDLILKWCETNGVNIPDPSRQVHDMHSWDASSNSIRSFGSSLYDLNFPTDLSNMSLGSLDTSYNSDSSRVKANHGLNFMLDKASHNSRRHRSHAQIDNSDLMHLSKLHERQWESQCQVIEDMKIDFKRYCQAFSSVSSENFTDPITRFLSTACEMHDVKALRSGTKLLLEFIKCCRNDMTNLSEDTCSMLASLLDTKVIGEALSIMEELPGNRYGKANIAASSLLTSVLKILDSGNKEFQQKAIKIMHNFSSNGEICPYMVSFGCIPKLLPFFEDRTLMGDCIHVLKNLCDTQEGRVTIVETKGCISSVVDILGSGSDEEKEPALAILLSLCSQRVEYCLMVMDEGIIPSLVNISNKGSDMAKAYAYELLRLLRDDAPNEFENEDCYEPNINASQDSNSHYQEKKSSKKPSFFQKLLFPKSSSVASKTKR